MKGSTFKRCPCPVRRDAAGRKMTCAKAHGSWSYMADRADAEPGGRRQLMKGGFPTRKVAEAALTDYLSGAGREEPVTSDTQRLADYLAEWLTGMRLTLAVAAWTNYRSVLNLYVTPRIGQLRLTALTGPTLTALYADLLDHGGQTGRSLSPTTTSWWSWSRSPPAVRSRSPRPPSPWRV